MGGVCSLPVIYLGPNYGGGNEDNGELPQKIPCTAALIAPNPAAGHHRPMPPLETPGHSQASLGRSLVRSLLLSPGSWCAQGSVCALQESVSQSCVSSGGSMVGLMETSSNRVYAISKSSVSRAPAPVAVHCWPIPPQETLKHSLSQLLWGLWVLVWTRFVWALWASLAGMEFDSKLNLFAPPIILLGLLLCPWTRGVSSKRLQRCAAAAPAFLTLYGRQESRPSPRKRNAKKQNGCLRRAYK